MNTAHFRTMLAVTSASFSTATTALTMSKHEYQAAEKTILSDYDSAAAHCASFTASARSICVAAAKRTERIAQEKLRARYQASR